MTMPTDPDKLEELIRLIVEGMIRGTKAMPMDMGTICLQGLAGQLMTHQDFVISLIRREMAMER